MEEPLEPDGSREAESPVGNAPDFAEEAVIAASIGAPDQPGLVPAAGEPPEPGAPPDRPLDPPKLVRLANLAREVLEEVRQMDPHDSTVQQLAELYRRVEDQLKDALPQSLAEELDAMDLDLPFNDGASRDEVRIAYSGLIGWLGGLFQGLHASLLAAAAPVPVMIPGREGMPPGPMGPMGPQAPAPRPGLEPARRPTAEERKGEGYL